MALKVGVLAVGLLYCEGVGVVLICRIGSIVIVPVSREGWKWGGHWIYDTFTDGLHRYVDSGVIVSVGGSGDRRSFCCWLEGVAHDVFDCKE